MAVNCHTFAEIGKDPNTVRCMDCTTWSLESKPGNTCKRPGSHTVPAKRSCNLRSARSNNGRGTFILKTPGSKQKSATIIGRWKPLPSILFWRWRRTAAGPWTA